jgi:hypothetical protein
MVFDVTVMSPVGLGTQNHCAGDGQKQFSSQLEVGVRRPSACEDVSTGREERPLS